jgi:hypothetical protein
MVRGELTLTPDHAALFRAPAADDTAEVARGRLEAVLRDLAGCANMGWMVGAVSFPWDRAFEIDLRLERTNEASSGVGDRCRA